MTPTTRMRSAESVPAIAIGTRSSGWPASHTLCDTSPNLRTPVTLKTFCASAAALLLANTAYLAAAASPTVFYMGNVLAHVVLGAVLWIAALILLARNLSRRSPWAEADNRFVVVAFV